MQTAADLHADAVYAGQGRLKFLGEKESGDEISWMGRGLSRDHHVNPVEDGFGAHAFGVESGGDAGRPVTGHGALISDSGDEAGYFDEETESLRNTALALSGESDRLTEYTPLGPTEAQKNVIKGLSGVME